MEPRHLERVSGEGLFFVADPHVAAVPPGQRLDGYQEQILDKLRTALILAQERRMPLVLLGDLFHWPRENPNSLLVELIELFAPHRPFALIGNHDKYQARYTRDVSMAVLEAAGAVRVIAESGPAFVLDSPAGEILLGASPDGTSLPTNFDRGHFRKVVWISHHNIAFPDFPDKAHAIREIPGVDWVVNGHVHRQQPQVVTGQTTWANPGNIARLVFSRRSLERRPAAAVWRPDCTELDRVELPFLDFYQVFPDQDFPVELDKAAGAESSFLAGLERLTQRRTCEGWGLKQFLEVNLNPEAEETRLIWDLYEEVTNVAKGGSDEQTR